MRELILQSRVSVCSFDEFSEEDRQLIDAAREAATRGYAPYSHFNVGAAVRLIDGTIVTGNNQENAAYPSGICAERTALFWAGSQYPDKAVVTLAIAARNSSGEFPVPIPPCGACRQVLLETQRRFNTPIRILLYGTSRVFIFNSIDALLPFQFSSENLQS